MSSAELAYAIPTIVPTGHEPLPHVDITQTKGNMTRSGAEKLARAIRTYWMQRGFSVKVWAEHDRKVEQAIESRIDQRDYGVDPHWVVRSNLVGGLPPWKLMQDGYERG